MKIPSILITLSAAFFLSGCGSSPSVGEQLIAEGGTGSRALGEKWNEGENLISSGEKMRKKGDNMISDGKKMISKGDSSISDGRQMKAEAETEATQAGYLQPEG